jgi:putative DNA primase/helicase
VTKNFINIPEEMRQLDRWVCWRLEERDGKPTKVPVNPSTGGQAMSNNSTTWGTYRQAVSAVKKFSCNGIGFMFNGDGLLGVDLDNGRNPDTGEIEPWAREIINELDSYTEISQSGRGIHILCYGKLPTGKRRRGNVEMYETGRYFIMTGDVLDDAHMDIEDRTEQLAAVHQKYLAQKKQKKNSGQVGAVPPADLSPWEIIDKAGSAKNGNKFRQLMSGDISGYNSQSEADLALCNIIAFYTQDVGTIDAVYRQSNLMREKWDELRGEDGTYGQITINRAIQDATVHYSPGMYSDGNPSTIQQYSESRPKVNIAELTHDMGRARRFARNHQNKLLWCQDIKSWLIWTGKVWEVDRTLQVQQFVKVEIDKMVNDAWQAVEQAAALGDDAQKKAKEQYQNVIKARSERGIKSIIELTKGELPITPAKLDADPFLVNCQNGIIDLRTGELKPHRPEMYMTRIAGAEYVPGKKFELFGEFMKFITCEDADLARYLQQVVGMAAIGKVFHEGLCIFYGSGQNGKSTFLNCMSKIFNDYSSSVNPEMLMSQRDGKQPIGITKLDGKRFVTAMELEEGRRMSSAMLKQLASTDPITGREMYQSERTFDPTHTLIMATNHLPKVSSTDVGTWRRIMVVPFKASIEGRDQIKDYANVLYKTDADAILTWIIEGAIKYIHNGYRIEVPEVVAQATQEYRNEEDWLGNFLLECCDIGSDFTEMGGNLYDEYSSWCDKNNEYTRRNRDFAAALVSAGFEKMRTTKGSEWVGLRLQNTKNDILPYWSRYAK